MPSSAAPDVDTPDDDHRAVVYRLGQVGVGGEGDRHAGRGHLVGRLLDVGAPAPHDLRRLLERVEGRREGHLGTDRMQPEGERGHYAEVAAAAPQRPEEIRMLVGGGAPDLSVGADHLGLEQVVGRQAVLSPQPAVAPAEGEAGHAGVRDHTARRGEPERPGWRRRDRTRARHPAPGPGGARCRPPPRASTRDRSARRRRSRTGRLSNGRRRERPAEAPVRARSSRPRRRPPRRRTDHDRRAAPRASR